MRDLKFFRGKGAYYSQRNSRIMCASLLTSTISLAHARRGLIIHVNISLSAWALPSASGVRVSRLAMEAAGGKLCDCTGLPVTCASREAVKLFDELLVQFISVRKSVLPLARRILALDPDFILVHCLMVSARIN